MFTIKRFLNRRQIFVDHTNLLRTQNDLIDLVYRGLGCGIVSKVEAELFFVNGFHPAEALILLEGSSLAMEAEIAYWQHIDVALEMLESL